MLADAARVSCKLVGRNAIGDAESSVDSLGDIRDIDKADHYPVVLCGLRELGCVNDNDGLHPVVMIVEGCV